MPAITLITDFGLQDGHVGAMKGVLHQIAPHAPLIDVSHSIAAQNVRHGAFVVLTAYPFWPADTVHLIVVDPGVGTKRRAVAIQTEAGTFVAPDNGVLTQVLARVRVVAAVELDNPRYWRHPVSAVFSGRDIFGPAAAHLASGVPIEELGTPVKPDSLTTFALSAPEFHSDGRITAHVQHVDGFGNCTTDLARERLAEDERWQIRVKDVHIDRIRATFGDVPQGTLVALIDSTGFLAIALRNGSAERALDIEIGDPVYLRPV